MLMWIIALLINAIFCGVNIDNYVSNLEAHFIILAVVQFFLALIAAIGFTMSMDE